MELRELLLPELAHFVCAASQVRGVVRIALVGSLATEKEQPKDADVLVTIDSSVDIDTLAAAGRRLQGRAGSAGAGADVFLSGPDGTYLGKTCSFRECHPRVRCSGHQCNGSRICDNFEVVRLDRTLIDEPPLELWPAVVRRQAVPQDVERLLIG